MATRKRGKVRAASRPIMQVLDVVGQRWALRVLWELRDGPLTFRTLAEACGGLSPTTLNARLSSLQELGVVDHEEGRGYALTESGSELGEILMSLSGWADAHVGG